MRFRAVLAVVALMVAGIGVTASAAPPDGRLVIEGSRTAYVDITLVRKTTESVRARGYLYSDFTTSGTYAAYLLEPLSHDGPRARGLLLAAWSARAGQVEFMDLSDPGALRAGRYRLYLMTDGATRFSVTLPGYGATIVARPKIGFSAEAKYQDIPAAVLGSGEYRRPFVRTSSTLTFMALYGETPVPAGTWEPQLCLARRRGSCADADAYGGIGWKFLIGPNPANPAGGSYGYSTMYIMPTMKAPSGDVEGIWADPGVRVASSDSAFLLHTRLP